MGKTINKEKIVLILIFIIFSIFILLLAFKLKMGISPDSYYHLDVSQAYSTTLFRPENSPDTYQWRDITRIAYLYFWINGRILNINNGVIDEVILLRIVNIIYSVGTVYITYLLSKEIFKKKWQRILPIVLLTNTLMFVFLSSSINYDNLANLLSVVTIFFFVKFVKSKLDFRQLLLMILFLCLGTLTKYTILPLALILVILSGIHIFRLRENLKGIKIQKEFLLLIPILILGFLNLELYGTNILKYGGLEPECNQILTHDQCLLNGVYYRDNVTYDETKIDGLKGTLNLISSGERVDPFRYFIKWLPNITMKIFGIMADKSLYMPEYFPYIFITLFVILSIVALTKRKEFNNVEKYLLIIFLFYLGVLFFMQNYSMYLRLNHYYLALQGRYIFPVISIMYILFSKSIFLIKKKWFKYILLISFLLLLTYSCIPFFVTNVPSQWIK